MTVDRPLTDVEQSNNDAVREALGVLGLHDQRRMVTNDDLGQFEITISAAELLKLAARADHLVELERLMRAWHANTLGEGSTAPDRAFLISFESKLAAWCRAHDFSMIEPTP